MDSLGRTFLTIAHNKFERTKSDGSVETVEERYSTRVVLDIEGNQREVIDAKDRVVMHYDYDMLGSRIHSASMDAGERWMLNDVAGQPIRAWDARGHEFRTEYDQLHRPLNQFVRGTDANESDPRVLNRSVLFGKIEYGEGQANDIELNLRTRAFKSYDNAGVLRAKSTTSRAICCVACGNWRQTIRVYRTGPERWTWNRKYSRTVQPMTL